MEQDEVEGSKRKRRTRLFIMLVVGGVILESLAWTIGLHKDPRRELRIQVMGSLAFLATVCIFAPQRYLRDPDIAGSAADYPMLVRGICAVGSWILWVCF